MNELRTLIARFVQNAICEAQFQILHPGYECWVVEDAAHFRSLRYFIGTLRRRSITPSLQPCRPG